MLQNSEYIIDAVQMGGPRLAMNISFFLFWVGNTNIYSWTLPFTTLSVSTN